VPGLQLAERGRPSRTGAGIGDSLAAVLRRNQDDVQPLLGVGVGAGLATAATASSAAGMIRSPRARLPSLVIRNSRYSGEAIPNEARERGIVVRVASAIVDVAKASEFCKGQRRVDRSEFVGAFRDKAV
jgi:hypothetical protein